MPTADGQYHLDEFVGEVIGIAHLRRLNIEMPAKGERGIVLIVGFDHPTDGWVPFTSMGERTMGLALADVRQQIRDRWGQ